MALVDMPLSELVNYQPGLTRQQDFEAYWDTALAASAAQPLTAAFTPCPDYPVTQVDAYEVRFAGFDGSTVAGRFLSPRSADAGPCLVVYHGYGGWGGRFCDLLMWALQGYSVFAVDVRRQAGESVDPTPYASGSGMGQMTLGILDPAQYFYRGVYMDCVRAIQVVAGRPEVHNSLIALTGGSQGGGLTIAAASIYSRLAAQEGLPALGLAMPDVPYLCHFRRAVDIFGAGPYVEIPNYLKQYPEREAQAFTTLSYCDGMNLAPWITCPTLVSVGLQDIVCPPSTVYAAYNHMTCAKEIAAYPYAGHEGGQSVHTELKIAWLRKKLPV
jgi:cephalosporin-C deacetylase